MYFKLLQNHFIGFLFQNFHFCTKKSHFLFYPQIRDVALYLEVGDLYHADADRGNGERSEVCITLSTGGYARIADIQRMEAVWKKKAPLANISTCDNKSCVKVKDAKYTNKNGDIFYIIKN